MGAANIAAGLLPGLRRLDERLAHGRGRAVGRQEPGHRASSARRLVVVLLLFLNSLLADLPQTALAAIVIVAALSLMDLAILRRYCEVRRSALGGLAGRHRRRDRCSACCRGSWSPSCSRSCCSSGATGGRTAPCSAAWARSRAGTTSARYPDAEQLPGRRRLPLGGAAVLRQRRLLPRSRSAGSRASASPRWIVLQCEAVTDVDVSAARDARAARQRAQRRGHPPRLRRAAQRACRS